MAKPFKSPRVPWDGPDEWIVWLILLIVATLIIHNGMRTYKKERDR